MSIILLFGRVFNRPQPVGWASLRCDRERLIYIQAFWRGFDFAQDMLWEGKRYETNRTGA